jgi:hypothetical protein
MKLLELDERSEVKINQVWIAQIPEFKELFKDSAGKVRYSNPKGVKYLTYIYFMLDFTSPIRDWIKEEKAEEARRYTGLTVEDVKSPKLKDALAYYTTLQYKACRPLKSFRAAQVALNSMDEYFETVDFSATDKQGKLLYNPNQFTDNIAKLHKAYQELAKLENFVLMELQKNVGIRGQAEMGDEEIAIANIGNGSGTSQNDWEESGNPMQKPTEWTSLDSVLNTKP